jgi:hypothetical protein
MLQVTAAQHQAHPPARERATMTTTRGGADRRYFRAVVRTPGSCVSCVCVVE